MAPKTARRTDHVWYARSFDEFDRIHVPGINLCIRERLPPARVVAAIDAVTPRTRTLDCSDMGATALFRAIIRELDVDAPSARWLADDVIALKRTFIAVSGDPAPRVLFECETDETCTLLHVDALPMRLLTVYAGDGSVWAPNGAVRRRYLGTQSDAAVCPEQTTLRHAPRFAALLFKGEEYPGEPDNGLVHRSPPVPSGTVRIKVRINRAYG